jgi:hypothetical protein
MTAFDTDALYALLPLTVRTRDLESGNSLRALIDVVAGQAQRVDDSLDQLYDDSFIETCSPWATGYIGELIGYRALRAIPPADGPARADVADTIGLRRRKGTLSNLDQLARDVTGWPAVVVEFFARLAVSQYVRNHVRPQNACVDVRGWQTALDIGTAFDMPPRTADVRRIASGRGRYNIPNVGIFLYRLRAYGGASLGLRSDSTGGGSSLASSTASRIGPNRYRFDPFGEDVQLVNPPAAAPAFSLTTRAEVPFPLRRVALYTELEALRAGSLQADRASYFGAAPVLAVYDAAGDAIPAAQLAVCDLTTWAAPTDPRIRVVVDPELGRLMCNPAVFSAPAPLRVSYAYAFSGDYGGGTYARIPDAAEGAVTVNVDDLALAAPASWTGGVVEVGDSGIFPGDVTLAQTTQSMVVRAADYARPVIGGDLTVIARLGARLTLRGIGVAGNVVVVGAAPAIAAADPSFTLRLEHCTVRGAFTWTYPGGGALVIEHSLCASLGVHPAVELEISDSVIDGAPADPQFDIEGSSGTFSTSSVGSVTPSAYDTFSAIAAPDMSSPCGGVSISASTVFGSVRAREARLIENSIMTGPVNADRTQAGCVRYSYLPPPPASRVPPRFRCQPDLAIESDASAAARIVPAFTSRARNEGGYAQLADTCPAEIRTGAEDGDEMGVFLGVYAPRREANLRFRLDEYLRIGLEAGVIHAS